MTSFIDLLRLWDGVSSHPIKNQKQRMRIKIRISQLKEEKEIVRCFRDAPGFLMIANRRKRLDDYFKR
jgi:hypothetical protein